ncbi:MAG: hypothetical protein K2O53_00970 [Bacteroidales bacterium]|nr:hypothetical protein [Bacteroidales bacterium]
MKIGGIFRGYAANQVWHRLSKIKHACFAFGSHRLSVEASLLRLLENDARFMPFGNKNNVKLRFPFGEFQRINRQNAFAIASLEIHQPCGLFLLRRFLASF